MVTIHLVDQFTGGLIHSYVHLFNRLNVTCTFWYYAGVTAILSLPEPSPLPPRRPPPPDESHLPPEPEREPKEPPSLPEPRQEPRVGHFKRPVLHRPQIKVDTGAPPPRPPSSSKPPAPQLSIVRICMVRGFSLSIVPCEE